MDNARALDLSISERRDIDIDEHTGTISLRNSSASRRTGLFVSGPFPVGGCASIRVRWRQHWTTPVRWRKSPDNPVLRADESKRWDGANISTLCVVREDGRLRFFYGSRPNGIGLAFADERFPNVWEKHPGPVLTAGESDSFDGGGVLAPRVFAFRPDKWLMYYVGYSPSEKVGGIPVHQIGLAESDDRGVSWRRRFKTPVIPRGPKGSCDGFSASAGSVLRVGKQWYFWYAGISQVPYLASICLATSSDGYTWRKYKHNPVLGYNPYIKHEAVMAAKPHVLVENGKFKMWYSVKGLARNRAPSDYRICYAESVDGIDWVRYPGNPVLRASRAGWDRTMVEYAEVLNIEGTYHMWYCGDGYQSIGHAKGMPGSEIRVQTRHGMTELPDRTWSDWCDCSFSDDGAIAQIDNDTYVQVSILLTASGAAASPSIDNLEVVYE